MMTMKIPRCHNIHNNSKDIQLHGGIERQARGQKIYFQSDFGKKKDQCVGERRRTNGVGEKVGQELARLAQGAREE